MTKHVLNPEQQKAVETVNGPVMVIAGAGSGKTRALTERIYRLIKTEGIAPSNILAITFTNKATNEMRERLESVDPNGRISISTFHAFCAKLLREHIYNLSGFTKYYTIYNDDDKTKILKLILNNKNLDPSEYLKSASYAISEAKNIGLLANEFLHEFIYKPNAEILSEIYDDYEKMLAENNALDFDDLLVKTYQLLVNYPAVLAAVQNKYKYIHVDEFQDTNLVQYKILKLMAWSHRNIFVVGDEDQCIYGWRGASIENTNLFLKDFAPVNLIKLEQNYRSTQTVLEYANKLIINNKLRNEKKLWTKNDLGENINFYKAYGEQEEAEYVAQKVHGYINSGIASTDIAILFRMGALSRLIEEKLLNYNIKYTLYGAFKFYERLEIKNALAYFWLIYNPQDNETLKRIINFPKRGIGKTSIEKLEALARENGVSLHEVIDKHEDYSLGKALFQKLNDFRTVLYEIKSYAQQNDSISEIFKFVFNITNLESQYNKNIEEEQNKLLNLGQLKNSVQTFERNNPGSNLMDYLQSVTLQTQLDDTQAEDGGVRVSTVHAVKGLEFKCVFIIGLEENIFPISRAMQSDYEMEEERRLLYVALTRSERYLHLSYADSRFLYNGRNRMLPSRFLREMGLIKTPKPNTNFNENSSNYEDYYAKSVYITNNQLLSQMGDSSEGFSRQMSGFSKSAPATIMNNYANNSEQFENNISSLMTKKIKSQNENQKDFTCGTQVLHPKFGVGTVISSNFDDGNNSVNINFGGLGIKCLNLDFAPLQIIKRK